MLNEIEVKRLKLFKQVVECGGLSAAETALNINLPTISAHLAGLEKSLGMRLCDRGRKGFKLTPEGLSVLESCNRLFQSLEDFQSDISRMNQTVSGQLRLGIVDNIITDRKCRLAETIADLKAQNRRIEFTLDTQNPSELERLLLDEQIDVAIGPFHIAIPGIEEMHLYSEDLSLYIGNRHRLYGKKTLQKSDLLGMDYAARGYLRESQVGRQIVSFNTSATAKNIEGLAFLVMSGAYAGYLPDHYAKNWLEKGLVRKVLPQYFSHRVECKAITLKKRRKTRMLQTFLDTLKANHGG